MAFRLIQLDSISERPNTSSGLRPAKPSENAVFDRRVSKDDLALGDVKSIGKAGYTSYHIPIRGKPPTPDSSPKSRSKNTEVHLRVSTPESIQEASETGVIAIGMALGSPTATQTAIATPWHTQSPPAPWTVGPDIPSSPPPQPLTRSRSRRWALFGRSKSKRAKDPDGRPQRSLTDASASASKTRNALETANGQIQRHKSAPRPNEARKTPKHQPIIIRSQTEPMPASPQMRPSEILAAESVPSLPKTQAPALTSPQQEVELIKRSYPPPPASWGKESFGRGNSKRRNGAVQRDVRTGSEPEI